MKMLKYIVAAVLFTSSVFAKECSNASNIKELTNVVHSPKVLSGRFVQEKTIGDMGIKLKSEGHFSIDKAKGIKWVSEKPVSNTIIIEDNKICMDNGSQITIINSDSNQTIKHIVSVMKSLLVQDYEVLEEHFDLIDAQTCGGFNITLKSKDSTIANVFTKFKVAGSHYVETVVFENKDGDVTTIRFSEIDEKSEGFSCE